MVDEQKRKVFEVAKHEAGHWLVWRLLRGKSGDIDLISPSNADPKGSSQIPFECQMSSLIDAQLFVRARIITLWAGVYAQTFDGENFDNEKLMYEFNSGGGRLDWLKADEYLFLYANMIGKYGSRNDIHREIDQETAMLVVNNFGKIERIANGITLLVKERDKLYSFSEGDLLLMLD
ncbi:hypothetical protein [Serratia fonticola]